MLSRVPEMATVQLDLASSGQQQAGHFEFMDDELIARPPTSLVSHIYSLALMSSLLFESKPHQ